MHQVTASPVTGDTVTLSDLIDGYMAQFSGRDSARLSQCAYLKSRPIAAKAIGRVDPDDIEQLLDAYASSPARQFIGWNADGTARYKLRATTPKPASINRMRSTLSALFKFARKRRLLPRGSTNPVREIETLRENNARVIRLDAKQRAALLASARVCGWNRMPLLIELALCSGGRKSELLNLRGRDLDLDAGLAHVARSKNGDSKTLVISDDVCAKLRSMKIGLDDLLFPSRRGVPMDVRSAWKRTTRGAKLDGLVFHGLRHACASALAETGASTIVIASVLGHRQLTMAQRYSHLSKAAEREAVQRALAGVK